MMETSQKPKVQIRYLPPQSSPPVTAQIRYIRPQSSPREPVPTSTNCRCSFQHNDLEPTTIVYRKNKKPTYRKTNDSEKMVVDFKPQMMVDWQAQGHFNVETTTSERSVAYLYNYLFKGVTIVVPHTEFATLTTNNQWREQLGKLRGLPNDGGSQKQSKDFAQVNLLLN